MKWDKSIIANAITHKEMHPKWKDDMRPAKEQGFP